jgi:hypothetical protein
LSHGFKFREFASADHLADLSAIGASADVRQGQAMARHYIDEASLRAFCGRHPSLYGVFNEAGVLRAYAHAIEIGDVFFFNRILGHADDLKDGVVWLLLSEVVAEFICRRRTQGRPSWALYDTFWGASPGLRFFKQHVGFAPYRVEWIWSDGR